MTQYWLVVGTPRNWTFAFENGCIWGLKQFREMQSLWNLLQEGDKLLFYVASPIKGVVGCGKVVTKFRQTTPLWPDEVRKGEALWPLRFEFDVEYCLPSTLWESMCFIEPNVQLISRMVFQCVPASVVHQARVHLGLQTEEREKVQLMPQFPEAETCEVIDHETGKNLLAKIGRMQGFLSDVEYPIEGNRLDVVWRRVQRSVPTYAFEVQIGGDIYHALAKLKHAYDLWNSHIFLVAELSQRSKCEELLAGTFHEIKDRIKFVSLSAMAELYRRKVSYMDFERDVGILIR